MWGVGKIRPCGSGDESTAKVRLSCVLSVTDYDYKKLSVRSLDVIPNLGLELRLLFQSFGLGIGVFLCGFGQFVPAVLIGD